MKLLTIKTKGKGKPIFIAPSLYSAVEKLIERNKKEYKSISFFIESALKNALELKKYDIEGIAQKEITSKPMKWVVKPSNNFSLCLICQNAFLKETKDKSEIGHVCGNCRKIISYFSRKKKK